MVDQNSIINCKTERVESKADISTAARLSRYYQYEPLLAKEIDKLVNSDWWCNAELLTDICKVGKHGYGDREAVCFLLVTEVNLDRKNSSADLHISCFAPKPWYDLSIAVTWADFRIGAAHEYLKDKRNVKKLLWPVDERNQELQIELRDKGWRCEYYKKDSESLIFTK